MSESDIAELYRRLSSMEATIVGLSLDLKYQNEIQSARITRIENEDKESRSDWRKLAFGIIERAAWAGIAAAAAYFALKG